MTKIVSISRAPIIQRKIPLGINILCTIAREIKIAIVYNSLPRMGLLKRHLYSYPIVTPRQSHIATISRIANSCIIYINNDGDALCFDRDTC
jgi:hypothetical protein